MAGSPFRGNPGPQTEAEQSVRLSRDSAPPTTGPHLPSIRVSTRLEPAPQTSSDELALGDLDHLATHPYIDVLLGPSGF